MTDMPWEVRSLRAGDVETVYDLERRTEGAAHWPDESYLRMVEPVARRGIERRGAVALTRGRIVGFIAGRIVLREAEIENIAVDPEFRLQGVARALVTAFVEGCKRRRCTVVRLEVRESNAAARALYAKAGFGEEGRRKGYYRGPDEDAVVMSLALDGHPRRH